MPLEVYQGLEKPYDVSIIPVALVQNYIDTVNMINTEDDRIVSIYLLRWTIETGQLFSICFLENKRIPGTKKVP